MSDSIWSEGDDGREEPFTDGDFGFEDQSEDDESPDSGSFWDEIPVDDLDEPVPDSGPSSIPVLGQLETGARLIAPGFNMAMDIVQYGARSIEEAVRSWFSGRRRVQKEEAEEEVEEEESGEDETSVFFD